jgi:hypothetical protein
MRSGPTVLQLAPAVLRFAPTGIAASQGGIGSRESCGCTSGTRHVSDRIQRFFALTGQDREPAALPDTRIVAASQPHPAGDVSGPGISVRAVPAGPP